ncbi:MAG: SpoIIE family protein phosphatase [Synergistaceae bacterium]|jgi:sigma-B regulation protein RsbU (phosphoserine phosphatase)|nr:SpoIIE family protein phosphatase [Synergistaceae bacterium]
MTATRRYSLATKFALLFGAFAIVVGVLICSITYASYRSSMLEHYGKYAIGAATLAASVLDPEDLSRYANTLERDEHYAVLEKELDRIRKSLGVRYLYVQIPVSDTKYMYLFDLYDPEDADDTDTSLGTYGDYDENFRTAKLAMSTGQPFRELDITVSEYGYLASAYVPILGKDSVPFAYVGVDISMDYILGFLIRYLAVIASATAAVMVFCFTALFFLVRSSVVNPIRMIAEKAGEFTRKVTDVNFEELDIRSSDEIGDLSASVNTMFGEIRNFTSRLAAETAHRERVQSELDMARGIQESVLPKIFPPFHNLPDITIFAGMTPAKEVGGDFYDFFVVGEDKLAVVIADVSGKGVSAALFMMVARTLIKHESFTDDEPRKLLETVNNRLCENNDAGMFVTLFIGMLDMKRNVLEYANAGHNPPVMLHNGRAFWLPTTAGMALGVMENMEFATQEMPFGEGDLLLLYTDGVTEAMNEEKELFGNDRLIELLSAKAEETITVSPKELIETLREAVVNFAGDAEQSDDITMLAFLKTGK